MAPDSHQLIKNLESMFPKKQQNQASNFQEKKQQQVNAKKFQHPFSIESILSPEFGKTRAFMRSGTCGGARRTHLRPSWSAANTCSPGDIRAHKLLDQSFQASSSRSIVEADVNSFRKFAKPSTSLVTCEYHREACRDRHRKWPSSSGSPVAHEVHFKLKPGKNLVDTEKKCSPSCHLFADFGQTKNSEAPPSTSSSKPPTQWELEAAKKLQNLRK